MGSTLTRNLRRRFACRRAQGPKLLTIHCHIGRHESSGIDLRTAREMLGIPRLRTVTVSIKKWP
ncbi:hypothetical protein SCHPADRAFT_362588 [Schizopora paradoxa]|uniref:Uncharacterized protein n=1 Tax=Schizopora paradoxa TaxID=27342 RepID=A0A0H2RNL4_9AGAM|nr:hypothetical protein SCHPADRAFT_362588 [Schizopora paradoxa]